MEKSDLRKKRVKLNVRVINKKMSEPFEHVYFIQYKNVLHRHFEGLCLSDIMRKTATQRREKKKGREDGGRLHESRKFLIHSSPL